MIGAILQDINKNWLGVILIAGILLIAMFQLQEGWEATKRKLLRTVTSRHGWALILQMMSVAAILVLTLLCRTTVSEPLTEYLHTHWFPNGEMEHDKEILENLLLFMPFGFTLFMASPEMYRRKKWRIPLIGALVSLGISLFVELSQLLFGLGYFQFSDLFYNTIGGALGSLIWLIWVCFADRYQKRGIIKRDSSI